VSVFTPPFPSLSLVSSTLLFPFPPTLPVRVPGSHRFSDEPNGSIRSGFSTKLKIGWPFTASFFFHLLQVLFPYRFLTVFLTVILIHMVLPPFFRNRVIYSAVPFFPYFPSLPPLLRSFPHLCGDVFFFLPLCLVQFGVEGWHEQTACLFGEFAPPSVTGTTFFHLCVGPFHVLPPSFFFFFFSSSSFFISDIAR